MTEPVLGVILAGGRGTRMGGADKALLPLCQRALVAHVAARLAPQCAGLAINANGNPARFAPTGLPVVPDSIGDNPGPLAGILAGLDFAAGAGFGWIATVAADTPFFPAGLVARMWNVAGGSRIVLAADRDGAGPPRLHPTFGLWQTGLRDELRAALLAGTRRVREWADGQGAVTVVFDGAEDPFFNINTPADLEEAEKRLAHRR